MNIIRSRQSYRLAFITAALAVIAAAINLFFAPHGVAAGGATGIAIIVQELLGVPVYISTLAINIVMLILAAFLLSKATTLRILYGSLMLPLIMAVIPEVKIVGDRTLAVMVGSVIMAVASRCCTPWTPPVGERRCHR
nr:YitT family protein [Lacticaseibacillus sharpeae]